MKAGRANRSDRQWPLCPLESIRVIVPCVNQRKLSWKCRSCSTAAKRMHASGESAGTIAETLGVSRATVYRALGGDDAMAT